MAAVRRARLASQNANKLAELQAALPGWEIEPLVADGWPEETGGTYEENARLKARFGRALAGPGEWVLGEDSGIECDALGGEPGLHSARWAPRGDQADALLERLGDEPRPARADGRVARGALARRRASSSAAASSRARSRARAEATGGFGYDPIFVPEARPDGRRARRRLEARALAPRPGRARAAHRDRRPCAVTR